MQLRFSKAAGVMLVSCPGERVLADAMGPQSFASAQAELQPEMLHGCIAHSLDMSVPCCLLASRQMEPTLICGSMSVLLRWIF